MFNFTANRVVSEVRDGLADQVTDAKTRAPAEEHPLIELAGQCVHFALDGAEDDLLAEVNAYGSNTPSTGGRTFTVSVSTRAVKARAAEKAAAVKWTPEQGPLGPVRSTFADSTATAAPAPTAGTAPAVAVPGDTTAATPASTARGAAKTG